MPQYRRYRASKKYKAKAPARARRRQNFEDELMLTRTGMETDGWEATGRYEDEDGQEWQSFTLTGDEAFNFLNQFR